MTDAPLPNRRRLDARERAWLQEVVEQARRDWAAARRQGSPAERAQALACLSGCVCDLEGPIAALRLSRRAHRLWTLAGDPAPIAVSSAVLAVRLLDAGRPEEALRQATLAREAMRNLGPSGRHAGVSRCLGKEFLLAGYAPEAQAWLELALEGAEEAEQADILGSLASALDLQGKLAEAKGRQHEACASLHRRGDRIAMAQGMLRLARLELRIGQRWSAAILCREISRILTRRGYEAEAAEAQELLGLCHDTQPFHETRYWGMQALSGARRDQ